MLWLKALHIIAMVAWFAGLFYLPRLFVYHAMTEDDTGRQRFIVMERKLYRAIMTPAAVATLLFGLGLISLDSSTYMHAGWMHAKLALVAALIVYHVYCGSVVRDFAAGRNRHGHRYYRFLNEVPTLILIAVVILTVVKPF